MCKSIGSTDSLLGVENEHTLEEINSYVGLVTPSKTVIGAAVYIPSGSAFLNLVANG